MDNNGEKNLFNMPGDEMNDWLRNLSRYVLVVELVATGACLPILTYKKYIILTAAGILMYLEILAMYFCNERKDRRWIIIRRMQFAVAVMDTLTIIISILADIEVVALVMTYVSLGVLWIHSGLCFFEYRKNEIVPLLRFAGAFTICVTLIVFMVMKQWLIQKGISF